MSQPSLSFLMLAKLVAELPFPPSGMNRQDRLHLWVHLIGVLGFCQYISTKVSFSLADACINLPVIFLLSSVN